MSKYTRLNKINHYHDNGSTKNPSKQSDSRMRPPKFVKSAGISKYNNTSTNNNNNNNKIIIANYTEHFSGFDVKMKMDTRKGIFNRKPKQNKPKNLNFKLAFFASFTMMMLISITLFFLLVPVDGVYSLNCYHCSSVDNPECDEAFTGKANITETDCEKHIGQPAKVCRKIVQYIEQKKVVIRSCGFIDEHEEKDKKPMCHKRSGTFAIMMESCNCYTDNCNHSASLVPNRSVLLILTSSLVLLFIYSCFINNYQKSDSRQR